MSTSVTPTTDPNRQQRLVEIFQRLLPIVNSLARKLLLTIVLGILIAVWLMVWCLYFKHYSITVAIIAGFTALLPTAIVARFWWAVEELKELPQITSQMIGDAKGELSASLNNLRNGTPLKTGFFSVGKNLWSVGSMVSELRELAGTYFTFSTLINPFMLILGAVSIGCIFLLFFIGIALGFFL